MIPMKCEDCGRLFVSSNGSTQCTDCILAENARLRALLAECRPVVADYVEGAFGDLLGRMDAVLGPPLLDLCMETFGDTWYDLDEPTRDLCLKCASDLADAVHPDDAERLEDSVSALSSMFEQTGRSSSDADLLAEGCGRLVVAMTTGKVPHPPVTPEMFEERLRRAANDARDWIEGGRDRKEAIADAIAIYFNPRWMSRTGTAESLVLFEIRRRV